MATLRKPRGRPTNWPNAVTAPEPALELYRLIARLMRTPNAFAECHVYHGARVGGEPYVKWEGKVTKLPVVIASYMGLPQATRRCDTEGCCNPFHYLPGDLDNNLPTVGSEKQTPEVPREVDQMAEWEDLIYYELDRQGLRVGDVSFEQARDLIHSDDLTDTQLASALKHMKGETE